MRLVLSALAICAPFALHDAIGQTAGQETYPNRPVRLVVPVPAGGPTDVLARVLGQNMSEKWGQSVVIENRPGAGSAVAAAAVARSKPDGYTLLMAMDTTLVMNPIAMKSINYKVDDFAPISLAASNTSILVAPANGPKTIEELIAKGRADPGKLNYGAGIITTRLGAFLFSKLAGLQAVSVPYNGSAEVVRALAVPDVRGRMLNQLGLDPVGSKPAEFGQFVRDEITKWAKIAKAAGVKATE